MMLLGEPTPKAPEELGLAVGWCEDKLGDDPAVPFFIPKGWRSQKKHIKKGHQQNCQGLM